MSINSMLSLQKAYQVDLGQPHKCNQSLYEQAPEAMNQISSLEENSVSTPATAVQCRMSIAYLSLWPVQAPYHYITVI